MTRLRVANAAGLRSILPRSSRLLRSTHVARPPLRYSMPTMNTWRPSVRAAGLLRALTKAQVWPKGCVRGHNEIPVTIYESITWSHRCDTKGEVFRIDAGGVTAKVRYGTKCAWLKRYTTPNTSEWQFGNRGAVLSRIRRSVINFSSEISHHQ